MPLEVDIQQGHGLNHVAWQFSVLKITHQHSRQNIPHDKWKAPSNDKPIMGAEGSVALSWRDFRPRKLPIFRWSPFPWTHPWDVCISTCMVCYKTQSHGSYGFDLDMGSFFGGARLFCATSSGKLTNPLENAGWKKIRSFWNGPFSGDIFILFGGVVIIKTLYICIYIYIWLVVKMLVPGLGPNTSFPLGPASKVSCGLTIPSF